ncbi:hypothetical protein [Arsenicibacter rosenii]|nr:hypothetical protein [Arsenicibacter rosenii]
MRNVFSGDRMGTPFGKAAQSGHVDVPKEAASLLPAQACFGLAPNHGTAYGFKMLFSDDKIAAIYYHDLVSPVSYDPAGIIDIHLSTRTIRITGRNLKGLFEHFFDNRVLWVKEPDSLFSLASDNQAEIETIRIEENG